MTNDPYNKTDKERSLSSRLEHLFGSLSFNDKQMRRYLPKSTYKEMLSIKNGEAQLDKETADIIAASMKQWAMRHGATHFTHWFQPLTGLTAEKQESFLVPQKDGTIITDFSGKELIMGEPDASSFPSGGLRATFEARGYTAWDISSPAFIKKNGSAYTLTIPTIFISYTGEALDKKTPILRTLEYLNKAGIRLLRALGDEQSSRVISTVGAEQEYFLIQKELYDKRPDLQLTGRAVIGSMPAKGQEMDDHYFGMIKDRVANFMDELNKELWLIGVTARTQHNEVAPNQFELASIFTEASLAVDQNQLVMEIMKRVAERQGLVCLLHEKPFAGVNGSGKHNNWSLATDLGENLLEPGTDIANNKRFLLILSAIIKAVDTHAALLRATAASAGNDHRLGANEAPPAIISIYLGAAVSKALSEVAAGGKLSTGNVAKMLDVGNSSMPDLLQDNSDRNRTSPFAFTGNKFEFRMLGSSQSIAGVNVTLNSAVAENLEDFAKQIEKSTNQAKQIDAIITSTYKKHSRIIFNGNGYSKEWELEGAKRGLANTRSTVDALEALIFPSSIKLFGRKGILSKSELQSRYHIYMETYAKTINIEASILLEMIERGIIPSVSTQLKELANSISAQEQLGLSTVGQRAKLAEQNKDLEDLLITLKKLQKEQAKLLKYGEEGLVAQAKGFSKKIIPQMDKLKNLANSLEQRSDEKEWPYPSFRKMLFNL